MSITQIHSRVNLRNFLTYDFEWVPGSLEFRLGGTYDRQGGYRSYRSVRQFFEGEFHRGNHGKWFYAHNGGLADVQFVISEIRDINAEYPGTFRVKACLANSSAVIVKVWVKGMRFTFLDSLFLMRDRLANILKGIGMAKAEPWGLDPDEEGITEREYERRIAKKREWYAKAPLSEIEPYNEIDCKGLWKAIDQFEDAVLDLGGQLQPTIAATGLNLFRRQYLTRDITTSSAVNALASQAYVASRVENARLDVFDAKYYDINSSFPYAMTFPCPGEVKKFSRKMPDNDDAIFMADCDITVPDTMIPPLPLRYKDRIFFPCGSWRSWFSSIDLRLLEECGGTIDKTYDVVEFSPMNDLADYARDIYQHRVSLPEDSFRRIVDKYLMNCLYGKFAESSLKSSLLIDPEETPITIEDKVRLGMEEIFPGVWSKDEERVIAHAHVPLSMHITAIGRRTIYRLLEKCREWHYCDTDGFSTNEDLDTSSGLGGLKLEKIVIRGRFAGCKFYQMEALINGMRKVISRGKGFSRLNPARWNKLLEGQAIEYERMARMKENFRSGRGKPTEKKYSKRVIIKHAWDPTFDPNKHTIPKRFFYPDGHSRAWTVNELKELLS